MCINLVEKYYFCCSLEEAVTPIDGWLLSAEDDHRHCRVTSFYSCAASKSSQRLCPRPEPADLDTAPTTIVLVLLGDCNSEECLHQQPRSRTDRFGKPHRPRGWRTVWPGAEEEMEEIVWGRERNRHLMAAVGIKQEVRGGPLTPMVPVREGPLVLEDVRR